MAARKQPAASAGTFSCEIKFCSEALMKRLLTLLVCLVLSGIVYAQESRVTDEDGRMFFPRDTFWGYAQFDLAPPHNEIDPNLCAANAKDFGGQNAPCNAFARYMLWGTLEVRPFGRGILRRAMFFGEPKLLFGRNVPQSLYTWSADAIGLEHAWGVGIYMGKGFELRVTQHFLFDRWGARDRNLGAADLGTNGPWGRFATVGVRKTFGQRRW
jgi:hypothetical protein